MLPSTADSFIIKSLTGNSRSSDADFFLKTKLNKVTFYLYSKKVLKRNNEINKILKVGRDNLFKQTRTIKSIVRILSRNQIPFLISRTKRTLPYITYDIDIIVPEKFMDLAVEVFSRHEYVIKRHGTINGIREGWQKTAQKKDELLIDIHKNVSWLGGVYLSESDIWANFNKGKINNVICPIPDNDIEFLLVAANILFEKFHLTLLDYLYLSHLFTRINHDRVIEISKRYEWNEELELLIHDLAESKKQRTYYKLFKISSTFPLAIPFSRVCWIIWKRVKSGFGVSFVAVLYITYMYLKMFFKKGSFYPYYFDPKTF